MIKATHLLARDIYIRISDLTPTTSGLMVTGELFTYLCHDPWETITFTISADKRKFWTFHC